MRPIEKYSLTLEDIARLVSATSTLGDSKLSEIEITGVSDSDAHIEDGDLFLAIPTSYLNTFCLCFSNSWCEISWSKLCCQS